MKSEQIHRRVCQRIGDTVHDVRFEYGLRGFRVAPQGAFKVLLMLRWRRVAEDHRNHQVANLFVKFRGMRIEQYAGAARGQ